ncbi:MAG: AAA family ATPase [Bacteroidales bacterium]|nr:AAA family ATPase [Bacteroidales bacterium]
MKIKSVQIKSLWNTYDINLNLNDSVNVLSGINGCGKSTILEFVLFLLVHHKHKLPIYLAPRVKSIIIDTDKGTVYYESFNDNYLNLKKNAESNSQFSDLKISVDDKLVGKDIKRWDNINIAASVSYVKVGERKLSDSEMSEFVDSVDFVSVDSFDSKFVDTNGDIIEEGFSLDSQLKDIFVSYSYYIGSLAEKIGKAAAENNLSKATYDEIYSQRNLFVSIMNDFLRETDKEIVLTNQEPKFMVNGDKDNLLTYKELSSGEKQVLLIMLRTLLQEKKEYIFTLDEPEISLHTDWQRILIEKIKLLNPNCQLIIATHAPSIILNGWSSCVQNIEDVRTVIK